MFVLIYIYFATETFGTSRALGRLLGCFVSVCCVDITLFQSIPILNLSAEYLPIALLITLYAVAFRNTINRSRGLSLGAVILFISITVRSVVAAVRKPFGTHFRWHILNSLCCLDDRSPSPLSNKDAVAKQFVMVCGDGKTTTLAQFNKT